MCVLTREICRLARLRRITAFAKAASQDGVMNPDAVLEFCVMLALIVLLGYLWAMYRYHLCVRSGDLAHERARDPAANDPRA